VFPPSWHRTERSTRNDDALFIVPNRNFNVHIKDGRPWLSLNFKLKNTVSGISCYWKIPSARAPENFFTPAVCFTSRDKNQIFEYSMSWIAAHVYWISRIEYLIDCIIITRELSQAALLQLLSDNNHTISQKRGFNEETLEHECPKSFVSVHIAQIFLRSL